VGLCGEHGGLGTATESGSAIKNCSHANIYIYMCVCVCVCVCVLSQQNMYIFNIANVFSRMSRCVLLEGPMVRMQSP
jgi:hypothetical protein